MDNNKQAEAVGVLCDIVENDPENRDSALTILANLAEMWRIPDGCVNHTADSWGCCENCGCMVF